MEYNKNITKYIIFIISIIALTFMFGSKPNIRFVFAPREDNTDYGYLKIDGNRYRQLYTTTQVNLENGLHYHRIDLRTK